MAPRSDGPGVAAFPAASQLPGRQSPRDADENLPAGEHEFNERQEISVEQTELMRQRLLEASSLPGMLAAGWDAFELVGAIASASADQSAGMYPAFTFARGAAVSGRNAIAFAPSMPATPAETGHGPPPRG